MPSIRSDASTPGLKLNHAGGPGNANTSYDAVASPMSVNEARWISGPNGPAGAIGVIPIHQGAEQDPAFATEQFAGWFTEMNDERWQPTSMPTYLEEFGYFADVVVVQTGQEALLGQRSAEDVANEWAEYLTTAQKKWLAAQ